MRAFSLLLAGAIALALLCGVRRRSPSPDPHRFTELVPGIQPERKLLQSWDRRTASAHCRPIKFSCSGLMSDSTDTPIHVAIRFRIRWPNDQGRERFYPIRTFAWLSRDGVSHSLADIEPEWENTR